MFIVLASCNQESFEANINLDNNLKNEISYDIENNNLVIRTSENLKTLYKNLKSGKKYELELIKGYYSQGFYPMELVSTASDKDFEDYKNKKRENFLLHKNALINSVLGDRVINNDNFASILSEDGVIQVGDSIYKYTKKGLLITHVNDRDLINNSHKTISKNLPKSNNVFLYIPDQSNLLDFKVESVDECNLESIASNELQVASEFYGCQGGGFSSGGGQSSTNSINYPNTWNYTDCVNTKAGWIDNIFAKSYVCEYFFNKDKKLRTIFEAADFYFFQDVYAQAKFKNKTWFGWFSDRSANEVYLLNKKVILNTKTVKRGPSFSASWSDAVKIFNKIHTFFLSKPNSSIIYTSNEYDFNTNTVKTYTPDPDNLLTLASNSLNLITPTVSQTKPILDIDFDLKNFFGKKINKAITVNIYSLKYTLSNTEIIKLAYEALQVKKIDLKKGETAAIVFVYVDPETMKAKPVAYSLFGEKISVNKLAVAKRDFEVPQNFKIDDFSILFSSKHNNANGSTKNNIGFKFKFRFDMVNSVDIELESGALYNGNWGGSKFKVKY